MIRAIHFSAIAILAAASMIAATSAVSLDQVEAMSTVNMPAEAIQAHGAEGTLARFGTTGADEAMPVGKVSVLAGFIGEHGTGLPLSPNS